MALTRLLHRAFSGGEITPEMFGHVDSAQFQNGAATMKNIIAKPQGPAFRRPGFRYVRATKASTKSRLIPFTYNSTQTFAIEMGVGYFRFHTGGGTLLVGTPPAYIVSQVVTFDNVTNNVTWAAAHGLVTGTPVQFTTTLTFPAVPPDIAAGTIYYAIFVSTTVIQISRTVGGPAIDFTNNGTGVLTGHGAYTQGDIVERRGTVSAVDTGTETLTSAAAHGFAANDRVRFTNVGGGLPGGLSAAVDYFVIAGGLTAVDFRVSTSSGGAAVNLTSAGTGTNTWHFGTAGTASNYYLWQPTGMSGSTSVKPPTSTHWYAEPLDGVLEVPQGDPSLGYAEADLFAVQYTQSLDVLKLVHPSREPMELRRLGATKWSVVIIQFNPTTSAPTGVIGAAVRGVSLLATVTPLASGNPADIGFAVDHGLLPGDAVYCYGFTGVVPFSIPAGHYVVGSAPTATRITLYTADGTPFNALATTYTANTGHVQIVSASSDTGNDYVVTSIGTDGTESTASSIVSVDNNLFVDGARNTISWSAVTGAVRYRVYKKQTGLFGFIGQTDGALTFDDDNIAPDLGTTPPVLDGSLSGTDHPAACAYFEQRFCLGGTTAEPQKVWLTKTGTESDLSYSLPTQDSDRIAFRAKASGTIRHLLAMQHLLLLTSEAEYRTTAINNDALTPTSVSVRPQSYIGSNTVKPVIVNNVIVFCAARGGHVREMGFKVEGDGYVTGDLSLRTIHLFDALTVVDSTYSKAPQPLLWFVSSNGKLLGLTYVPEEQLGAWHQHDTDGLFESVCAVAEGDEDRLYVIVNRSGVRSVQRLAPQRFGTQAGAEACFLDASLTYNGAPATVFTGLSHLEGKTVHILADGLVRTPLVVSGGQVTLASSASIVHIGLPYTSTLKTLPVTLQIDAVGQGRTKNVNRVWVRVVDSARFDVGPNATDLVPALAVSSVLQADEIQVTIPPSWSEDGSVVIQQDDPLPLEVVALTMQVSVGD